MKIPMRILRQNNGLNLSTTEYINAKKVWFNKLELVGTTAQLERWWRMRQRRPNPLKDLDEVVMYNVEHEGVLECAEVQDILARYER